MKDEGGSAGVPPADHGQACPFNKLRAGSESLKECPCYPALTVGSAGASPSRDRPNEWNGRARLLPSRPEMFH